ncbi:hypothetical protein EZS27_010003 [termite gut metagenome]|uniref:BACON domain-containing protein n=1 Tax=termite gut metagenome TaxID=433724 RepID=A0A5J4S824_9ZZZZ
MKKHVFFWKIVAGILPFLFLGTGCDSASDDPELFFRISEENQAIAFSSGESSQTIAVETNTSEWTVYVSDEGKTWCKAVKEGESIVVSAGKNDGLSERSTTVTAIAQNAVVKITVTQLGVAPVLQIKGDDETITFETFGGDAPVNLTTNLPAGEWDVVFSDPTASEWCHIKKGNNQLTISVDENIEIKERTVEITITSDRIPADQQPKIDVLQFGTGYTLLVSENEDFSATLDSRVVTIRTNIPSGQWSFAVEPAESWCHVEVVQTADDKDNQLKITVDANSSLELRTAVITVSSELLPDAHPAITVKQAGVDPVLQVASNTQKFAVTGGEVILDITTNLPLEELSVELSDATAATWCVPKIEDKQLKITVAANTGQEARNVVVTISDSQRPAAPQATISVTQELPTLTIAKSMHNFEVEAGSVAVDITTNIPFGELNVTVTPTGEWCSAEIDTNGKLKITVEANTGDNMPVRESKLTILSDKLPGIEAKFAVIQLGTQLVLQVPPSFEVLNFDNKGGSEPVTIVTTIPTENWDFTPKEDDWYKVTREGNQLTIQVDENTSFVTRQAVLTLFSTDLPDVTPTITVNQAAVTPVLVIEGGVNRELEAVEGSAIVATTNIPLEKLNILYSDEPTSNWCSASIVEGNKLKIDVTSNEGSAPRSVVIKITSDYLPETTVTINVTQAILSEGLPTAQWTIAKLGNILPTEAVSTLYKLVGDKIEIKGLGKFEGAKQSFTFFYREITDDFVITARLDSYDFNSGTSTGGIIGLLFTVPDLSTAPNTAKPSLVYGGVGLTSTTLTYIYQHRLGSEASRSGKPFTEQTLTAGDGGVYFKLRRLKDDKSKYEASYSLNGNIDENYCAPVINAFTDILPTKLYVGLVVASADSKKLGTATFSDVRVDGVLQSFENVYIAE